MQKNEKKGCQLLDASVDATVSDYSANLPQVNLPMFPKLAT